MATIELTEVLFYKGGSSGASKVVGYEDSSRRVARYTFTAPDVGAQKISLTLRTNGRGNGSHIPIRFFIGTDPDSHANAGSESEYTGTLELDTDNYVVFTGAADIILLPDKTYYLWVFPGNDTYGWYSWQDIDDASTMDTEGVAFLLPVVVDGAWRRIMLHVTKGGKFFLIAPCVVKDGKWHYFGAPN